MDKRESTKECIHNHSAGANSRDSVITFVGCKVKGVLTGVRERGSSYSSAFTIVFDCGWGLSVLGNGAYFTVAPETIQSHISDLKHALAQAGEL